MANDPKEALANDADLEPDETTKDSPLEDEGIDVDDDDDDQDDE